MVSRCRAWHQCSRILSNVDFLELQVRHLEFEQESADGRAIESSHLLSKQPGPSLNADPIIHCLCCLHHWKKILVKRSLPVCTRHKFDCRLFVLHFCKEIEFLFGLFASVSNTFCDACTTATVCFRLMLFLTAIIPSFVSYCRSA